MRSRLLGVDSLKRDLTASAQVLEQLAPGFETGDYRPPLIAATFPLTEAVNAYRRVGEGAPGRILLHPQG